MINASPLLPAAPGILSPGPCAKRKIRRKGRVASLPKLQRDMVNRMLWNGVPYKNIVVALDDAGFTLIDRNISNWATGGYLEWRLEQEAVLDNRLNQDHLLDFLRRDDAPELTEVGLQAAATRLSQVLLQKLAHADDPEANLDNFSKLIDLACRLNREIDEFGEMSSKSTPSKWNAAIATRILIRNWKNPPFPRSCPRSPPPRSWPIKPAKTEWTPNSRAKNKP